MTLPKVFALLAAIALPVLSDKVTLLIDGCHYENIDEDYTYATTYSDGVMSGETLQREPGIGPCNGAAQQVTFGNVEVDSAKDSSVRFTVDASKNGTVDASFQCLANVKEWPLDKKVTMYPWATYRDKTSGVVTICQKEDDSCDEQFSLNSNEAVEIWCNDN